MNCDTDREWSRYVGTVPNQPPHDRSYLEQWRDTQNEGRLFTADLDALEFFDRMAENPILLLSEWVGRCPYGTVEQVKELNRRTWKARRREASTRGEVAA